jgi:hypothetical protein
MVGQILELPIGYWHDNTFYRNVSLGPVTGFIEEKVDNKTKSHACCVTQLLTGCVQQIGAITTITPEIIRDLSVSDRDFLVLKLRELTFGSKIECVLTCPKDKCGKKMNVNFDTNVLVPEESELTSPYFTLETGNSTIEFRLPNGGDQESIVDLSVKDPSLAGTAIFRRCIRSINGKHPSKTEIDNLSKKSKDAVMKRMVQVDLFTDLNMRVVCPECENEFLAPLDIQDFFLTELNLNSDVFYLEIHYLAYYYHWAEENILALPRWKRKKYVEFLIDELSGERG